MMITKCTLLRFSFLFRHVSVHGCELDNDARETKTYGAKNAGASIEWSDIAEWFLFSFDLVVTFDSSLHFVSINSEMIAPRDIACSVCTVTSWKLDSMQMCVHCAHIPVWLHRLYTSRGQRKPESNRSVKCSGFISDVKFKIAVIRVIRRSLIGIG